MAILLSFAEQLSHRLACSLSHMRGKPNDHNNYFSNAIDVDALPTGSAGSVHARLVLLMLRSQ